MPKALQPNPAPQTLEARPLTQREVELHNSLHAAVEKMEHNPTLAGTCTDEWIGAFAQLAASNPHAALRLAPTHILIVAPIDPASAEKMGKCWITALRDSSALNLGLARLLVKRAICLSHTFTKPPLPQFEIDACRLAHDLNRPPRLVIASCG